MKRLEENREQNRNDQAVTENTGRASKIAKNLMAAGLAVGGAAAFGDMDVFASEADGDVVEESRETQQQSGVEQTSVVVETGGSDGGANGGGR